MDVEYSNGVLSLPANAQVVEGIPPGIETSERKRVVTICPVCRQEYGIQIPVLILQSLHLKEQGGILCVYVKSICSHRYGVYVDANGRIRGYQKLEMAFEEVIDEPAPVARPAKPRKKARSTSTIFNIDIKSILRDDSFGLIFKTTAKGLDFVFSRKIKGNFDDRGFLKLLSSLDGTSFGFERARDGNTTLEYIEIISTNFKSVVEAMPSIKSECDKINKRLEDIVASITKSK